MQLFRNGFTFFVIILSLTRINGQDIHFSQFYNSPLNLNPANTGVFNGDERFMASFKDQWRDVPVPWTTYSGQYDRKFYLGNSDDSFVSGGVLFNYDQQGLSRLNLANLNLLGSFTKILTANHLVTVGLGVGFATRGLSLTNLSWDRQWTGDAFDPNLPSGENNDMDRINFFENSLGVNYRYQIDSRTNVDLGVGAYHLLEPKVAFFNSDDVKLPRRINVSLRGSVKLAPAFDLQVHGLTQFQGSYNEYLGGLLGKIYVNQQKGKEFSLHLGMGYRSSKSLLPTIAIEFNNIYASLGYDIDNSPIKTGSSISTGGPEIHFRYKITHVKPLKQFKVCPIF